MRSYLTFQLYGPLQAWGSVAVGEVRPTAGHPTRSAVLGLVAAALGIRRGEEERLHALSEAYGVAVREDAPGQRLTDYHTVQTMKERSGRRPMRRADELGPLLQPGETLNTILSQREYLQNGHFTACLWVRTPSPPASLDELARALDAPEFVPYLGRKACPPALPFRPVVASHASALDALSAYGLDHAVKDLLPDRETVSIHLDVDEQEPLPEEHGDFTVRDVPSHFGRRQFATRHERMVQGPAPAIRPETEPEQQEAAHVYDPTGA